MATSTSPGVMVSHQIFTDHCYSIMCYRHVGTSPREPMSFIFMVFATSPQMQEVPNWKFNIIAAKFKQRGHETEVALNPWPPMPANQHLRTNALRSNKKKILIKTAEQPVTSSQPGILYSGNCLSYSHSNHFLWTHVTHHCSFPPFVVVVPLLSHVQLFATPWTAAHQASLFLTISLSLLKLMSIESVMPSNHLILTPLLQSPIK